MNEAEKNTNAGKIRTSDISSDVTPLKKLEDIGNILTEQQSKIIHEVNEIIHSDSDTKKS
jgi:hypothetical protein